MSPRLQFQTHLRRKLRRRIVRATLFAALVAAVGFWAGGRDTAVIAGGCAWLIAAGAAFALYVLGKRALEAQLGGAFSAVEAIMGAPDDRSRAAALLAIFQEAAQQAESDPEEETSEAELQAQAEMQRRCSERTRDVLQALREAELLDAGFDVERHVEAIARERGGFWEIGAVLDAVLPDRTLAFSGEHFLNEGDHAGLVLDVAEKTGGAFSPVDVESTVEHPSDMDIRVTVRFVDAGKPVRWRFSQSSDWVAESFLNQLREYVARRTGMEVVDVSDGELARWVLLPERAASLLRSRDLLEAW